MKNKKEGIELTCQRCKNNWIYKGKKGDAPWPEITKCGKCGTSVTLPKNKGDSND